MKSTVLLAAAAAGAILAAPAHADDRSYDRGRRIEPGNAPQYAYAKVVGVKPLYRSVRVEEPRRECWEEPVTRYHGPRHGGQRSAVPLILGGIIGGVTGNQFGSGSGNVAMTTAGALLGGAVAGDIAREHRGRHRAPRSYTSYEERCETRMTYSEVERADGYRVDYRYGGRVYSTHMDERPGNRIRVSVDVVPIGN